MNVIWHAKGGVHPSMRLVFCSNYPSVGSHRRNRRCKKADCVRINAGWPRPSQPASLHDILAFSLRLKVQFLQDKPAPFGDKGMVWFPLRYQGRLEPLSFSLRNQQTVDWLPLLQPFLKYRFARLAGEPRWIWLSAQNRFVDKQVGLGEARVMQIHQRCKNWTESRRW